MNSSRFLTRTLFGAAVAGALGFGAAQATARPAPAKVSAACLDARCSLSCVQKGYDYGACTSSGGCACYYIMP